MSKDSEVREGEKVPIDILVAVIAALFPERAKTGRVRKIIRLEDDIHPMIEDLTFAVEALAHGSADQHVDGAVILKLMDEVDRVDDDETQSRLLAGLLTYAERRWSSFVNDFSKLALQPYKGPVLFFRFPRLRTDPELLSMLVRSIAQEHDYVSWLQEPLSEIAPSSLQQARQFIAALQERADRDKSDGKALAASVFAALGRGLGWSPWIVLQTIIHARPDFADPHAAFGVDDNQSRHSRETIDANTDLAGHIEGESRLREIAGILLELLVSDSSYSIDNLLARPAETQAAYVQTLRDAIGDDAPIRQAVIETLLWSANRRAADVAQFAATSLAQAEDRESLVALGGHPVRLVRFAARAVRAAKFGDRLEGVSLPTAGSLLRGLAAFEGGTDSSDEHARTWLGDRAIERLIEKTIANVEARVARDYEDHGDEGEDRLLSSLFTELALRFGDLDQTLEGLARAASAPQRASVTLRYRNIDRAEEGAKGIRGVESFSADLCLIIDPLIEGKSLGRRVTLVQAKRLYRNKKALVQPTWDNSFKLNRDQLIALKEQTPSSVYFFHGPPLGGRGIPIIPTQLVSDLAGAQGAGNQIATTVVSVASRSLADWLTYDALALRVGDPYQDLVEKVEGRPGSLPRRLLQLPTVEVDIALTTRSEAR
ncbi:MULTISPECIES: hypothetical protein [unclassified Sphingomonas]|jgi:hypothetical protein|uniref:hypothetical protein n=1 Tax=unclassified Sphingomonas TaxID=196159 RepID=UPI002269D43B|nr:MULTISPECIES: hypothetical protein [unclassified Sphingomonas]